MQQYELSQELKAIYIRAKRRGMKELDILLGFVADTYLQSMTQEQINRFNLLLAEDDKTILNWLSGKEKLPEIMQNDIWNMLLSFNPKDVPYMN